jgi:hypothetical protein
MQKWACRRTNGHTIESRLSPARDARTGIKQNKHSLVSFPRLSSSWRHAAIPFPGVCCNGANGGRRARERSGRRNGSTNWGDDREGRATPPKWVGEQRVRGLASARIAPGHGRPLPAPPLRGCMCSPGFSVLGFHPQLLGDRTRWRHGLTSRLYTTARATPTNHQLEGALALHAGVLGRSRT